MITSGSAKRGNALKSSIAIGVWIVVALADQSVNANLTIDSVQIGFSGVYKVGHWVPIRVDATSSETVSGQLELITPDGEGAPFATVYDDQELNEGKTSLKLLVKFGRVDSYLEVRFTPKEKSENSVRRMFSTVEVQNALATRERLIVSIGSDIGIEQTMRQRRRTSNENYHVALVDTAESLPEEWIGYLGVDLLVLTSLENNAISQLTNSQQTAIVEYVRRGGKAILSAGKNARNLFTQSNPLASLLPGRFVETAQETRTGGIEEYVGGANQRLDRSDSPDTEFQYSLARVIDVRGQILASEGIRDDRTPLIIVGYTGIGQTIYTAFDLDAPMIAAWKDRIELLNRLMENVFPRAMESEDERGSVSMTRSGFDDLIGQLRVSLESFPGVRLTPFSIVAGFCLLYLAIIGPLDYFLLRRLAKSFSWTWLTFPLTVAVCSAAAFYFSAWSKSVDHHLASLHIVDVEERQVNGTSWLSLFSPRSEIHDYAIAPKINDSSNVRDARLTWQGLPGTGFGGMNGGVTSRSREPQYRVKTQVAEDGSKNTSMIQLPIATNSSRNFFGTWKVELQEGFVAPKSNLTADRERQLSGIVANPTSIDLSDCMLVFDRWTYSLNNIGAGESKSLTGIIARDIKRPLTRQKVKNGRSEMTLWDRESTDRARIGQMLMFYDTVRGESYTRLFHRFQNHIDGSAALKSRRAFLIGQAAKSPVDLTRDGEAFVDSDADHVTFYRISIPVQER